MSFDIEFRPKGYAEVIGQDHLITICQQYVRQGKGFHQSYLFAGPWGSGKTTMARILARALLCEAPVNGCPCDQCESCRSILNTGSSMDFTEIDAATNSGKGEIQRIVEEIQFDTFSGRRRLYLFDECFTENTVLLTPEGPQKIKDLVDAHYSGTVMAQDLDSGLNVWTPVTNWFDLGQRETFMLEFDNGLQIKVTENQLFRTKNRGWVSAKDLTSEDDVVELL